MNRLELLWRRVEVKLFNKKYCSMTTRHGHDLIHDYSKGHGMYRFMILHCSVCKEKFMIDATGLFKC